MTQEARHTEAFTDAMAQIPSCALDAAGVRMQRERYAALAPTVTRIERRAEALMIEFAEGFDRQTLEEALAVERACCPFFVFDFDPSQRLLRTTVREAEQLPALEAIEHALGRAGAHRAIRSA